MMDANEQRALKKRLADQLFGVEGVSGVAVKPDSIHVYVKADASLKRRLRRVLAKEAPGVGIRFIATPGFRKQAAG